MKKVYSVTEMYFDEELCYWQTKTLGYFSMKCFAYEFIKTLPIRRRRNVTCSGQRIIR